MSVDTMPRVVWFEDPLATRLDVVGGKCRGLAALAAAGAPVPRGFAVTTAAFREGQAVGPAVPDSVADAVRDAYRRLGRDGDGDEPVAVAVRSSATAEDLQDASFAGQQDTFLNIRGEQDVLDAVGGCWSSLHSERAVEYRAQVAFDDDGGLAMGVVVQELVAARVAGVMFTVNVQTGNAAEAVIEASWGLGEAVVSGVVTPDRFVVDKATGRTLDSRLGHKLVHVVGVAGGTSTEPLPAAYQDLPCLTAGQRRDLAAWAGRLEEAFGGPQDVEWAFDQAGALSLLQARPVTVVDGSGPRAHLNDAVS